MVFSTIATFLALMVGSATSAPVIGQEMRTVVVSGATGRMGVLVYKRLKAEGVWNVRALVRSVTKAKSILGCVACDESEGVFVGDVTNASSLTKVMNGSDVLVIATASGTKCSGFLPFWPFGSCSYTKGAEPKVIDWEGTRTQVKAFGLNAAANGGVENKQVLYASTTETEVPDNFFDKLGNGHVTFYHLAAEAFIMSSGFPFTVVKACGLTDKAAGKHKMVLGHDGNGFNVIFDHYIPRDDVARVLVESVRNPAASKNLRFDLCTQWLGSPTKDIVNDVLGAARYPWNSHGKNSNIEKSSPAIPASLVV
jgi:hypothetical protein